MTKQNDVAGVDNRLLRQCVEGLAARIEEADMQPIVIAPLAAQMLRALLASPVAAPVVSAERVALAYGLLWHVNAGMDAPIGTPSLTPEEAAYEARKVLRDMMTKEQRGDGINAAREFMAAITKQSEVGHG